MTDLIIENGTGLTDADVYCSIEDYKTFATKFGYDLPVADTDEEVDKQIGIFLVRGTVFIDGLENRMVGNRLSPAQNLAFPRVKSNCGENGMHLYDMRGLKTALLYAVQAQVAGFSLLPTNISKDDIIKKEKIDVLEVQYSEDLIDDVVFGKFPMIERYLAPYLVDMTYNPSVGR